MWVSRFVSLRRFSFVVCGQAGLKWPSISKLMATTKIFAKIRPQVTGRASPVLKGVCEDWLTIAESMVRSPIFILTRDAMFNKLYTTSVNGYLLGIFVLGLLTDRFGLIFGRICSLLMTGIGLISVTLLLNRKISEKMIFFAWPCLTLGGQSSHCMNVRNARSMPFIATTLMAFYAGCLQGKGWILADQNLVTRNPSF